MSTLSSTRPPPALHPQQRHIPLNNGHFDQRGIPALRLSLSISRRTRSTGAKDGGRTGYSVPGILIRTQWSLMLCQLCECVKASTAPLCADTHTHSTHPERAHSEAVSPGAGGVRATTTRAGIGSGPAVETPANGKGRAQSWEGSGEVRAEKRLTRRVGDGSQRPGHKR